MNKTIKNILRIFLWLFLTYLIYSLITFNKFVFLPWQIGITEYANWSINILLSILVTVIIYCFLKFLKRTKIDDNIIINKLFSPKALFIFMLITGAIFSFLIPILQTPDEITQINMIYKELGLNMSCNDYLGNYMYLQEYMLGNYDEKVNMTTYFDLNILTYISSLNFNIGISIIRHLPQTLCLIICSCFHLPVIIAYSLCELCGLLFYCTVCYYSIKLLPHKRMFMSFMMLLPICLQQMGSFNYDTILLPICFLYICYLLHIKFDNKKIGIARILKLLVLLLIIALIKIPYILLGILMLILPLEKFEIAFMNLTINRKFIVKHKYEVIISAIIISIITGGLIIYALRNNIYIKILFVSLTNLPHTIILLAKTFKTYFMFYIETIAGGLGAFEVKSPLWFIVLTFMFMFIFNLYIFNNKSKIQKPNYTRLNKIIFIFTGCILIFVLIIALVEWSIIKQDLYDNNNIQTITTANLSTEEIKNYFLRLNSIEGVQGRYFIPVIPLFFLPFFAAKPAKKLQSINYKFLGEAYFIFEFVVVFTLVLYRFWIV